MRRRRIASSKAGRLATIDSSDEYNQVIAAADASGRKVLWLGGQRDGSSFKWIDGQDLSFTAWASGEPNNDGGTENRMAMFNVNGAWGWYDVPGSFEGIYSAGTCGFVMERDVEVPA